MNDEASANRMPGGPEEPAGRECAKTRIYVASQCLGWGAYFGVQTAFLVTLGNPADQRPRLVSISCFLVVAGLGLLVTHFARRFLTRWDWKRLGWRSLGWRLFLFAEVLALLWNAAGFGYVYAVDQMLGYPWISRFTPLQGFIISWMNSTFVMGGWLCFYFFYHLFDRYNRLQIEQFKLSSLVKEAELRALKSQVNPHFIFNSLNSLRALIDENPARAREAVTQLANLLRYSLQSAQSETVAFEDELRVVNDYLALEQVRHEERLRVRLDVDPATLELAVPPLLLQTLAENAVKYGISPRPEGGEIAIIARRNGAQLQLRVINPGELTGAGMNGRTAAPASTGLGLKNATERLRHFFGEQASLQVRADGAERIVAEVSMPAKRAAP